ncbi:hypothetical protein FRB91_007660 [Serendipita sp. 411]|nr:hypothetical protein FRB91_007660 [Serendipita sp. 411]
MQQLLPSSPWTRPRHSLHQESHHYLACRTFVCGVGIGKRGQMDVSQPLPATLINLGLSIADLELYATRVRSGEYLSIAGITLLIYDYFCTFEEEWGHIWRQKPRLAPAKVLFAIVSVG